MKRTVKIIFVLLTVVLTIGYLVGAAFWLGNRHERSLKERQLVIKILDRDERQYVAEDELKALLRKEGVFPAAEPSTAAIEQVVRSHSMVRRAECFLTTGGEVRVELTQRIPVVRVITGAESYFIDTDRHRMPDRKSVV